MQHAPTSVAGFLLLLLFSPPPFAALLTQSQVTSSSLPFPSSHAEVITTKGGESGLVHVSASCLKTDTKGLCLATPPLPLTNRSAHTQPPK